MPMYMDITITIIQNPCNESKILNVKKLKKINIGKIPIMLGS